MKKLIYLTTALMFAVEISKAQPAMQFSGLDCNGGTWIIDVGNLEEGVYFITLSSPTSFSTQKIVVQHHQ